MVCFVPVGGFHVARVGKFLERSRSRGEGMHQSSADEISTVENPASEESERGNGPEATAQ